MINNYCLTVHLLYFLLICLAAGNSKVEITSFVDLFANFEYFIFLPTGHDRVAKTTEQCIKKSLFAWIKQVKIGNFCTNLHELLKTWQQIKFLLYSLFYWKNQRSGNKLPYGNLIRNKVKGDYTIIETKYIIWSSATLTHCFSVLSSYLQK